MSSDYYDRIGWTPPTPTEILTRATACLRRHDASDPAGMLGLDDPADVEVRPAPPNHRAQSAKRNAARKAAKAAAA